jgi:hypothetical protein
MIPPNNPRIFGVENGISASKAAKLSYSTMLGKVGDEFFPVHPMPWRSPEKVL